MKALVAGKINWFLLNCKKYMPVSHYLAFAQARHEFAGTFGGILWWIAEPVLYSFIYYFIFAVVFHSRSENFIIFLLLGLVTWRWFSRATATASVSIVRNVGLLRQVDVPKVIFPVQEVIIESYKFLLALAMTCLALSFTGSLSYHTAIWLPLVFVSSFTLLMGMGLILSAIVPFFPDMKKMIPIGFQGLMFFSGVFYQIERIPEQYRAYFYLNPLAVLVEAFRDALFFGRVPNLPALAAVFVLGGIFCMIGLYLHWRYNRVFARHLV